MSQRPWTDEDKERFLELVNSGVSTVEIARAMNRTRNAIIGAAHRLMLKSVEFQIAWEKHTSKFAHIIGTEYKAKVHRIAKPPKEFTRPMKAPTSSPMQPLGFVPPPIGGVKMADLTPRSCRYMIGDKLYCGEEIYQQSYCMHHYTSTRTQAKGSSRK